jgi:type VI secretion system protein VasG
MSKPSELEIHADFKAAYGDLDMRYDVPEEGQQTARAKMWFVKDLVKIAQFLYAEDPFKQSLDALEDAMQTLYKQRSGKIALSKIHLGAIAQSWMGEPVPAHSAFLMQSVLAENEMLEKFNGIEEIDGKLHPMKFFGNLSAEGFASNIKDRHLAVDYVGGDHGEYTHRIQWYCISKAAEGLGLECRSRGDRSSGELFQRAGPVWVKVFDRTAESDVNDFRRPEKLNLFLGAPTDGAKGRWPLLTGFLMSRRSATNGYSLETKILLVAKNAYGKAVKPGFLLLSPVDSRKEIKRLKELAAGALTETEETEIRGFLESNRVMTARDQFYVGSQQKSI